MAQLDDELLGQLLALLAHDLRNPLSALHSNLGFLQSLELADPDAIEAVDDTLISCSGLAHIIDNLDLLGRALRADPAGDERADLAHTVSTVVEQAREAAASHGLTLEADWIDCTVAAAPQPLSRALANLIHNGIQHSRGGGTVGVSVRREGARAVVTVADDGPPVAEALRDAAFTAPGQVMAKAQGRYGRGLGLYIAALAAQRCGGAVRALAPAGGGNVFELDVPVASPVTAAG